MRTLLPLAVLLAACGSDPTATPDPTEAANAAGVGGATSSDASSAVDASSSADASVASSSADASSGVGGEGGAPPATSSSSSSTGAGGDGGQTTQGGGYDDGSRIKARYFVGADGSRIPRDTYDEQLDVPCSFVYVATDGKNRCLPLATGAPVGFADAACTMPIDYWASTSCGNDYALAPTVGETPDGCAETRFAVHQRGAAVPVGTPKYSNASGSCVGFGVTIEGHYYASVVPPASFVEATTVIGDD